MRNWGGAERGVAGIAGIVAIGVTIGVGCVIPDKEINILREGTNEAAVRLAEPTPLIEAARCACQPSLCDPDDPDSDPSEAQCPQPTTTGLPHFLDKDLPSYMFCSCLPGEEDVNRLSATQLWVEDHDEDDEILAAIFLDLPSELAGDDSPTDFLQYTSFIDPVKPLRQVSSPYDQVELREKPFVRQLNLVTDPLANKFDLCNPDGNHISRGWHTLTIMVTDRPWYTVLQQDVEYPYVGVPDIAAGATFDTAHYAFFCYHSGSEADEDLANCQCAIPEEG